MKDFRFNDSLDEEETGYNEDPGEKKKIVKFLIIALVAAISGFSVYFITDALINGNSEPVVPVAQDVEMELNDEMIIYLYDNVTYSVSGIRNDKFFKSNKVTVDDFTTQDKFYYALRYAVLDDFVDMTVTEEETYEDSENTTTDDNNKTSEETKKEEVKKEPEFRTFSISNERIKEYMHNFFGENVTYTTDTPINIAVNFTVNGFNAGTLKYDSASDSFLIQFDSVSESVANMPINPYLYKKKSAIRKGENSNIVIEESVVFTSFSQDKDGAGNLIDQYDFAVYSDYGKTKMIEQKTDIKKADITAVGIENYKDNATTIRYTFFKDENDEYHFLSSEIVS